VPVGGPALGRACWVIGIVIDGVSTVRTGFLWVDGKRTAGDVVLDVADLGYSALGGPGSLAQGGIWTGALVADQLGANTIAHPQ
jgi:hypothetical protein